MTQKQLRKIARQVVADYVTGKSTDINIAQTAIAALHAPNHRGE